MWRSWAVVAGGVLAASLVLSACSSSSGIISLTNSSGATLYGVKGKSCWQNGSTFTAYGTWSGPQPDTVEAEVALYDGSGNEIGFKYSSPIHRLCRISYRRVVHDRLPGRLAIGNNREFGQYREFGQHRQFGKHRRFGNGELLTPELRTAVSRSSRSAQLGTIAGRPYPISRKRHA
jgi:hypothetical protein